MYLCRYTKCLFAVPCNNKINNYHGHVPNVYKLSSLTRKGTKMIRDRLLVLIHGSACTCTFHCT